MGETYTELNTRTLKDLERYAASASLTMEDPEDGSLVFYNDEICITVTDKNNASIYYFEDRPRKGERYYFIKYGGTTLNSEGRPHFDNCLELAPSYCCFCSPTFTGHWNYTKEGS